MKQQIIELYHTARISCGSARYARMIYVKNEMLKLYPQHSPKQMWFLIEETIS